MGPIISSLRGSRPDFLASVTLIGIGSLALWSSKDLVFGSTAVMGPGYMPTMIASLVVVLGFIIGVTGLFKEAEPIGKIRLRPLLILLAAVAGFAVAAELLGFVIASAGLIILGSMADREWRLRETITSSVVLTLFGLVVFIFGLDVQMSVGPF